MRNRLIYILIVLSIAVGYYFYYENKNIPKGLKKTENDNIAIIVPAGLLPTTKELKEVQKPIVEKSEKPEKIEMKSYKPVYDSDPVVDASLILAKHSICYSFLSQRSKKGNDYFKQFELQLDEKQKKYHKDYTNHCEKLSQSNPDLKLNDLKEMREQLNNAKATSLWGEIIQGDVDAENLSDYEVLDLLKQNNLSILTQAPKQLSHYYNKVIHWDLENVLANHQYDYVKQIRTYAHQQYLCSLGSDCGTNSSVMAMLCYVNSRGCGLNYSQYISKILTLGQQADVQLAMIYLQQKYQ